MTDREQYAPDSTSWERFCRFWSAHVDALERLLNRMEGHRSTSTKEAERKLRGKNREHHKGEMK